MGETRSDFVASSMLKVVTSSAKNSSLFAETVTGTVTTSVVKTTLGLLMAETMETTEVLVGTYITESTETVVDASTALKSAKSWSLRDISLVTVKA